MTKLIGLTGAYDFLERMILGPAEARYNPKSRLMRPRFTGTQQLEE